MYNDLFSAGKLAYIDYDSSDKSHAFKVDDPSLVKRLHFTPRVAFYNKFVYRDSISQKELVYKVVDYLSKYLEN